MAHNPSELAALDRHRLALVVFALLPTISYCKLSSIAMLRNAVLRALIFGACGATIVACGLLRPKSNLPKYEVSLYVAVDAVPSPSPTPGFAWANGSKYAVVVRKRERTLSVYRETQQEAVYPIVLGIASMGPKTYQGDLRTPEGVYSIVLKREHERWARFMLLSYPNDHDLQRYATALTDGRVPIVDGHAPGPGGAVGIHGTDREASNVRGENWTWGCVSMFNEHVADLYDRIPLGTPVLIVE